MSTDQLRQFFAHISKDPSLREQVLQAVSADAAALIAQELGYEAVSYTHLTLPTT